LEGTGEGQVLLKRETKEGKKRKGRGGVSVQSWGVEGDKREGRKCTNYILLYHCPDSVRKV